MFLVPLCEFVELSASLLADDPGIRLNAAEQRELQTRMEKKQMKDFMTVRSHYATTLGQ